MRFLSRWAGMKPATRVSCCSCPFALYLIAEHIGVSGILAAVAGMTITRSGVMRTAPLAMRPARQQHLGNVGVCLQRHGLPVTRQLPDILSSSLVAAESDPNVETWMLLYRH